MPDWSLLHEGSLVRSGVKRIVRSDVLYSLVAGLLQEHARQQDPPQVRVYSLTRRPPPESLTFPAKSFITFVSFSGVGGRDAAQEAALHGAHVPAAAGATPAPFIIPACPWRGCCLCSVPRPTGRARPPCTGPWAETAEGKVRSPCRGI